MAPITAPETVSTPESGQSTQEIYTLFGTAVAGANNPISTSVNTVTRTWTDTNGSQHNARVTLVAGPPD